MRELVDRILPTLRTVYNDIRPIHIDPKIFYFYQVGLVIGILLIIALTLLPGKPYGIPYNQVGARTHGVHQTIERDAPGTNNESSKSWAGDRIPKKELDRLQKKFKLTDKQMDEVMKRSRDQFRRGQLISCGDDPRALHDQLNRVVYIIIFSVLVFVINRDYNNFASFWFAHYFPSEARTLGLFVPEPKIGGP